METPETAAAVSTHDNSWTITCMKQNNPHPRSKTSIRNSNLPAGGSKKDHGLSLLLVQFFNKVDQVAIFDLKGGRKHSTFKISCFTESSLTFAGIKM